jgi:hypothetical protein
MGQSGATDRNSVATSSTDHRPELFPSSRQGFRNSSASLAILAAIRCAFNYFVRIAHDAVVRLYLGRLTGT